MWVLAGLLALMDCSHGGSWQRAEAAERRVCGGGTGEGQGHGEQAWAVCLHVQSQGAGASAEGQAEDPGVGLARPIALSTAAVLVLRRDFERGFLEAASETAYRQGDFWRV